MAFLHYIGSAILIILLLADNAPDALIISIAILLAGWSISSAIRDKNKK